LGIVLPLSTTPLSIFEYGIFLISTEWCLLFVLIRQGQGNASRWFFFALVVPCTPRAFPAKN